MMISVVIIATILVALLGIYKAIFSEIEIIKDWYDEEY